MLNFQVTLLDPRSFSFPELTLITSLLIYIKGKCSLSIIVVFCMAERALCSLPLQSATLLGVMFTSIISEAHIVSCSISLGLMSIVLACSTAIWNRIFLRKALPDYCKATPV